MRITGSPGSYGLVRLGNPYVRVIRGMPVQNWSSCDVLVTCKRAVYGVSAKGSQEPVRLPYGACTGPYSVCASTVRARTCLRTPVEFYDNCTWPVRVPVMAVSAHTSFWPRTTAYVSSTGKKKMCMHNFQTRAAYWYKGSIRAEKTCIAPCGPVRYAVNYPGAPCDLGISIVTHEYGRYMLSMNIYSFCMFWYIFRANLSGNFINIRNKWGNFIINSLFLKTIQSLWNLAGMFLG